MAAQLPLIGLTGRKRSGKDTVAAILADLAGYQRVSFADPVRRAALALDPIVDAYDADNSCGAPDCCGGPWPYIVTRRLSEVVEEYGWERAKDDFPEVRRTLQRLGTDAVRALDDGFWVRMGMARAAQLRAAGSPAVITDVRFPNEAAAVAEAGGIIVRVSRPGTATSGDLHPSEIAMDNYPADSVLLNDGTLDDLRQDVAAFVRYLRTSRRWQA